jgi:hypothetical protein
MKGWRVAQGKDATADPDTNGYDIKVNCRLHTFKEKHI